MDKMLIAATSMITPIGKGLERVYCSVEAGINRYQESSVLGSDGEPVRMALVPHNALKDAIDYALLTGELNARQKRLLRLATVALMDIKSQLPEEKIPLFLAGPEPYMQSMGVNQTLINNLSRQAGVEFDLPYSRVTNTGRAGAIEMMEIAMRYFEVSNADYALVGGVDSYYDVSTLDYLDNNNRLLLTNNKEGFVPGEAASFALLISPNAPVNIKEKAMAQFISPVVEYEKGHLLGKETFMGDALTCIFQHMNNQTKQLVKHIYSSENGESYYANELALAIIRNKSAFTKNKKIIRPAEYLGDIGAAFGCVMLGLAIKKAQEQSHDCPILVFCSSDSGARAGLYLTIYQNTRQKTHAHKQKNTQSVMENAVLA
ncbi:hypothetical protein [Aliikangiella sp. IMCC44359]|uniref:hypothetical protein n=1 Tax=Aliikangiella sp. IMCC44359 TaxID=3459125 RepID=UPI00403ADFED